ncbi:hypothetical protein [Leptolyngbya sp. FACHB-16]|uniref:hypothetical protein n=1 Tax=unclassified Leptolyngbya TaxID=2650499 RepID=UPI00168977A3|nr:hypothetical protein [Leptolyngbya sp. FACHB-16]MBD2155230.1 hypothetical protein [Leptolyngbya sp. FACHB-16]
MYRYLYCATDGDRQRPQQKRLAVMLGRKSSSPVLILPSHPARLYSRPTSNAESSD